MTLRIQCPSCQRQFKVGEELKGRTVECGACENRFLVDEAAIVAKRERYFPGDLKKPGLDHYGRPPGAGRGAEPVQFATASYDQRAKAADVIPAPPQRTFAVLLGVVILVVFAVILLFGAQEGGVTGGMARDKRIVLSAFMAAVGASLIIYGAHRRRVRAYLGAGALAALVMGLALFLEGAENRTPLAPFTPPAGGAPDQGPPDDKMSEAEVMQTIGYAPVAEAITAFGHDAVVALWVPVLKASFKYQIQRYLHRKTGSGERPSIYNRSPGGLILIEGTQLTLAEVERVVERFATVDEVYPNIRVLKLTIQGERLVPPSVDLEAKLEDKEHGAFYRLNEEELNHIDLDRIREAAHRLAGAEPKTRRPQITARLVELLDEDPDADFRSAICDAIIVWSEPGDGTEKTVARMAQELLIQQQPVPHSMMRFLVLRQAPEALAVLEALWVREPTTYEPHVIDCGAPAEEMVISHLGTEDRKLLHSAVTILKRLGTAASIAPLREALARTAGDVEMQLIIQSAIESLEAE